MGTRALSITVGGTTMSGKSAVAELIRQVLEEKGLEVELIDDNGYGIVDEAPGVIAETLNERLARIAELKTPVIVHTRQAVRMSK